MPFNSPSVHVQGGRLLRPPSFAKNQAFFGSIKICLAELADGNRLPPVQPFLGRIHPLHDLGKSDLGQFPGFVGGQNPVLSQREPTANATRIAILDKKRSEATRLDPNPETPDFIVPDEYIFSR